MINREPSLLVISLTLAIAVCGCSSNSEPNPGAAAAAAEGAGSPALAGQTASQGVVSFLVPTYTVNQAAGTVVIAVVRVAGSSGAVSVNYKTSNGSASAGTDYVSSAGTLSWKDGDTANKSIAVTIADSVPFAGGKSFNVDLSMPSGTATLGIPSTAAVTIAGAGASPPAATLKSIKEWVPCDGVTDYTDAVARAFEAAGSGGFTLVVDCPIRLHTGKDIATSIPISDGMIVKFTGVGEFRVKNASPPAFDIAHPEAVTLIDWNVNYL